ncbi:MAG: SPASM domain-containing protein [Candidatus Omnitrophica bacterium]|nr:SPASM domain-containing protein [Candidatus Omnitrophota bacterium]
MRGVELSHSGEIFLNPELKDILRCALVARVALTAKGGVNLNDVPADLCEALVRYRLRAMSVSIDGVDQVTYAKYRCGGDIGKVLDNIERINFYKKKYASPYPVLQWQFILFGHNEHQVCQARRMATEMRMNFAVMLNASDTYSPVKNKVKAYEDAGIKYISRQDFMSGRDQAYVLPCYQLWDSPQINWDGQLLGCCKNVYKALGNVFEEDLEQLLRRSAYVGMKRSVLGYSARNSGNTPCFKCSIFLKNDRDIRLRTLVPSLIRADFAH